MEISSSAFTHKGIIPSQYTCEGAGISPSLKWGGVPAAAKSLALICDDPDAPKGTWTHWVIYNMPPKTTGLEENVQSLPLGTKAGANSWGKNEYGAPCPPSGEHRYFFTLYALDTMLEAAQMLDSKSLKQAMKGHILAQTELMGRYSKKH